MTIPDWQLKFKNLPIIPLHKRWRKGKQTTAEQDIAFKLLSNIPITDVEKEIFINLTSFYTELDKQLEVLNYSIFSQIDLST